MLRKRRNVKCEEAIYICYYSFKELFVHLSLFIKFIAIFKYYVE